MTIAVSLQHVLVPKDYVWIKRYTSKFFPSIIGNKTLSSCISVSSYGLKMCDAYLKSDDVELYYISGTFKGNGVTLNDEQVKRLHNIARTEFPLKIFRDYDALSKEHDYKKIVSADSIDVLINGGITYSQPVFEDIDIDAEINKFRNDKYAFFEKMGWIK